MKIAVVGAGSWGTTLANMLAKKGLPVSLWVRETEVLADIKAFSRNQWYLPDVELDASLQATLDLGQALDGAEVVLLAVPSQFTRGVLAQMLGHLRKRPVIICASKGVEVGSLYTMSELVEEVLGGLKPRFAMLSGPSFSREVSQGMPTAVSLGCADRKAGKELQKLLSTENFRIYTTQDVRGVELGGAIKNVIAIGAGVADGLGFGTNARAALITRGLAEMSRLGKAMGADPRTFMGLSGLGDLVLTCTGDLSRNRKVGMLLGQGKTLVEILGDMRMVAEGVKTTEAAVALAVKYKVELPIAEQVYHILDQGKDPAAAVAELMGRALKEE